MHRAWDSFIALLCSSSAHCSPSFLIPLIESYWNHGRGLSKEGPIGWWQAQSQVWRLLPGGGSLGADSWMRESVNLSFTWNGPRQSLPGSPPPSPALSLQEFLGTHLDRHSPAPWKLKTSFLTSQLESLMVIYFSSLVIHLFSRE